MLVILLVGILTFLGWWFLVHRRDPDEMKLPPGPRFRVPLLGQMIYLGQDQIKGIRKLRKK